MTPLIVHDLDEEVRKKLAVIAQRDGQSVEDAVREILRRAVFDDQAPEMGLGSRIASYFRDCPLDGPIPELRGCSIEPPSFEP